MSRRGCFGGGLAPPRGLARESVRVPHRKGIQPGIQPLVARRRRSVRANRPGDELSSRADANLGVNGAQMILNRSDRDSKALSGR